MILIIDAAANDPAIMALQAWLLLLGLLVTNTDFRIQRLPRPVDQAAPVANCFGYALAHAAEQVLGIVDGAKCIVALREIVFDLAEAGITFLRAFSMVGRAGGTQLECILPDIRFVVQLQFAV